MHVHVQPIVHYTFIPLIIVLGMTMTGELSACPHLDKDHLYASRSPPNTGVF